MTRSDLMLAIEKYYAQPNNVYKAAVSNTLVQSMYRKIDEAWKIVIELEKDEHFKELGGELRKALES